MIWSTLWVGHLMAGLAGACATLAFSPYDFWPVLILVCAVAFSLMRGLTPKQAAWRGWVFGVGYYGAGVHWLYFSIHYFGSAPAPLAFAFTALFIMGLALVFTTPQFVLYRWLCRRTGSDDHWAPVLLFSATWVLFEWLRSWFLTGFPWLYAGYILVDTPMVGWAPISGVLGLSLLVVLFSSSLAQYLYNWKDRSVLTLVVVAICASLVGIPLQSIPWTKKNDEPMLSFAVVQGNIAQDLKWEPGHLNQTIDTYLNMTQPFWGRDVVLWPENAIPTLYQNVPSLMEQLNAKSRTAGTSLVLGIPWYEKERFYNSTISLGTGEGHYFKQKLVPFGEYVPFESVLRKLIAFFNLPMSSFSLGGENQQPLQVAGHSVAPAICYEADYPDFFATLVRNTSFLITSSNDTWFGTSIGPFQHFQMARMRALETGRYMVRGSNDGITALINDKGKVLNRLPQHQAGVLTGELPIMSGATPFMRFGSWPVLILCLLFIEIGKKQRRFVSE